MDHGVWHLDALISVSSAGDKAHIGPDKKGGIIDRGSYPSLRQICFARMRPLLNYSMSRYVSIHRLSLKLES